MPDVAFPLRGGSTAALTDRLRLRLLHLGGTTIDGGWARGDLAAPFWRVYLNLDDGAEVVVAGRAIPLRAGHLAVIPAWLPWTGRCRGRVRHLNAAIDLPGVPRERLREAAREVLHLGGPGTPLADAWLALGAALAGIEAPGAALTARGYALAYQALAEALARIPGADALVEAPGSARLADAVAHIDLHLGDPLPVAALARVAGCSPAELVRRWRAAWGVPPARWVRERRIAVAADQLRCTADPVEAVGRRCGFPDRTRFSKAFTALMGCGPAAWRRRERGA